MNSNKPLISIITPTYNRAHLLPQAIESVLKQTYDNWEMIIVDDGSKDNTKEVVENYIKKDPRIRYIYQENQGQPVALNTGLKNAKGELIALLDDDDEWLPNKLEKQLEVFNKDKQIGLVYSDALIVGGELNNKKSSEISKKYSGWVYDKLMWRNFITASSVIFKKEIIEKLGFFDEAPIIRKTQTQDYDLWLRISKYYKIGYVDEILVKYTYVKKKFDKRKDHLALIYIYLKNSPIRYQPFLLFIILEHLLKFVIFNIVYFLKR